MRERKFTCLIGHFIFFSSIISWSHSQAGDKKDSSVFDLPRIRTQDGQLYIEASNSGSGNISFRAASIRVGEEDLMMTIQAAKQIPRLTEQLADLARNDNIPSNVSSSFTGNGSQTQFQESFRRVRQLQRKVKTLEVKIDGITSLLNKDDCLPSPCRNGATCIDKYNGFTCLCSDGWEGPTCEDDRNECELFLGTELGCENNGTCINTPGSYRCSCLPAWHGLHCTNQKDDCTGSSNYELCASGTCVSGQRTSRNEPSYSCICDQGWTKLNNVTNAPCNVDIDECGTSKSPCSTEPPVPCINTPGSFKCGSCPPGYSGNGLACNDINECLVNNGGCSMDPLVSCVNTLGSYYCGVCPYGYRGDGKICTTTGMTSCFVNNGGCSAFAQCSPSVLWGNTVCRCRLGYIGDGVGPNGCRSLYPVSTVNPCDSSPCQNGGICISTPSNNGYKCFCVSPWNGTDCSTYMSSCGGNLSGPSGRFSTPTSSEYSALGRTGTGEYAHNSECVWEITGEPNEVVWLKFLTFNLEGHAQCRYDYVEIIDPHATTNTNGTLARICGKDTPQSFTSSSNKLVVKFMSDASVSYGGFIAIYTTLEASKVCGGELRQASGTIKSPGFPEDYPAFSSCTWVLGANEGYQIVLNITDLDLEEHDDCQSDYVEVRNGGSENSPLVGRFCGHKDPIQIKSHTNKLFIRFISDRFRSGRGFKAIYHTTATGCNGVMRAPFGSITSPNYPSPYSHNTECYWHIHAAAGSSLQATVVDFDLESSHGCKYDSMTFYDGATSNSRALDTFCGTTIPQKQIVTTSNEMYIKFRSDLSSHGRGFHITYQAVCQKRLLKQRAGVIESPGFPEPYPADSKCDYQIEVARGNKINITFSHFGVPGVGNCSTDYLQVHDGDTENARVIGRFCGTTPPKAFQSTSHQLYLKFVSDATENGAGFRLEWVTHGCGGDIIVDHRNLPTQLITSPKYPSPYPPNTVCEWRLASAEYGYGIKLDILDIDLESHASCRWDKLVIFNGQDDKSPPLTTVCHTQNDTQTLASSSPYMFIRFHSDQSKAGKGFKVRYSLTQSECGANFSTPNAIIQSVGYPGAYAQNLACVWLVTVAEQHVVVFNISSLKIDITPDCATEYLAAYDGDSKSAPLLYQGCRDDKIVLRSMSNKLLVEFRTNDASDAAKTGFQAEYTTGCGAVLYATATDSAFISPNFPSRYGKHLNCSYVIQSLVPNSKVILQFTFMDIEERGSCTHDYVEVRNGDNIDSPVYGKYCGRKIPAAIISSGSALHVRFVTDDYKEEAGWRAVYSNTLTSCGGELSALEGQFTSPSYPDNYPNDAECVWTIKASPGNLVDLSFVSFNLGDQLDDPHCNNDYVEIREGSSSGTVLGRYCGDEVPINQTSSAETLWVMFRSSNEEAHSGFMAEYRLKHGGEISGKTSGQIASPLYPMNYPHNSTYTWRITTSMNSQIRVKWLRMDMEDRRCYFDYLALFNGASTQAPIIGKYCGFEIPEPVLTNSNQLFIVMHTDRYGGNGQGFLLDWEAVPPLGQGGSRSTNTPTTHTFDLTATRTPQRIVSPGFPIGLLPNQTYDWRIRTDDNSHIEITIQEMRLSFSNSTYCLTKPNVILSEGTTFRRILGPLCGNVAPPQTIVRKSSTSNMKMVLETGANPANMNATGFNLTYQSVCGASMFTNVGHIHSDGYYSQTNATSGPILCIWNITGDFGSTFDISFDDFELSDSRNCTENYLQLKGGFESNSPQLGVSPRLCGSLIPGRIETRSNRFQIRYYKAATVAGIRGFSLRFRTTRYACGGELRLTDFVRSGLFATPNHPSNYPANIECEWVILAPGGDRIRLDFMEKFELERVNNNVCPWDFVEIRDGATGDAPLLGTYCGTNRPGTLRSRSNVMYVKFHSDRGLVNPGFQANYSIASCGGTIIDQSGSITSPNYPQSYPISTANTCEWYIQVPVGHSIKFEVRDFALRTVGVGRLDCEDEDYLEFREFNASGNVWNVIKSLCGKHELTTFSSSDSQVSVTFRTLSLLASAPLNTASDTINKFRVLFSANSEGCGGTLTTPTGTISSPGYPNAYPNNGICVWKIQVPAGRRVFLEILNFDVDGYGFCQSDFVEVYNGILADSPRMERLCGSKWLITDKIYASMNTMMIRFHTDGSRTNRGFRMRYSSLEPAICGGSLDAPSGVITSPGYSAENLTAVYPQNTECIWVISNPKDTAQSTINLDFVDLETETTTQMLMHENCRSDFIEIRAGGTAMDPLIQTLCGRKEALPETIIMVPGYQIWIRFRTDYSHQMKGFRLVYNISDCGGVLTAQRGSIMSPNYPSPYPNDIACAWQIVSPFVGSAQVQLAFVDVDMEDSENCSKDSLEILNGRYHNSPRIGNLTCGSKKPEMIRSQGSALYLRFRSDSDIGKKGFKADFLSVTGGCGGTFHGNEGYISTPGYDDIPAKDYPSNVECVWDIIVNGGYHINFTFVGRFDVEKSDICSHGDYVEVYDYNRQNEWAPVSKLCGHQTPNATISSSNRLRVKFFSDTDQPAKGFSATWTIGCGGRFTDPEGIILSPGFPDKPDNNLDCRYEIVAPLYQPYIMLEFDPNFFDIEGSRRLMLKDGPRIFDNYYTELVCHDYLIVYGENNANESDAIIPGNQSGPKMCGGGGVYGSGAGIDLPQPITTSKQMTIIFHTDFALAGNGFRLTYKTSDVPFVVPAPTRTSSRPQMFRFQP